MDLLQVHEMIDSKVRTRLEYRLRQGSRLTELIGPR